ncbi:MAG: helix-turn-helix transcriptional regulator [Cohaesibacteraceae bacterium]|nr:helix-turn-helix transcriptional regulator [Cohaesibacteraceae bacterium]MBL4876162.1 helix-turn-helix transcriptional regulator [Cohaesibacteraceae bacterium]
MNRLDPDQIDLAVGMRIRERRNHQGLSQTALADIVSVSFQQIQKYESGANRVSASRLVHIADALEVAPEFFVTGLGNSGETDGYEMPVGYVDMARTSCGAGVLRDWQHMSRLQQQAFGNIATAIVT